jgi:hypothetical protein
MRAAFAQPAAILGFIRAHRGRAMTQDIKHTLADIESGLNILTLTAQEHTKNFLLTNARLDQIIALLTPKETDENALSDLLGHLVMLGREQLTLAQRTIQILAALEQRLPPGPGNADETAAPDARRPL